MPPTFFYHLKFELYPQPGLQSKKDFFSEDKTWLPPSDANIFHTDTWPDQKLPEWWDNTSKDHENQKPDNRHSTTSPTSRKTVIDCGPARAASPTKDRNLFILSARKADDHPPPSPALIPFEYERAIKDWRYGAVRVRSFDMISSEGSGEGSSGAMITRTTTPPTRSRTTKAKFEALKGKDTEIGWGVVHLYRDGEEASLPDVEAYNAEEKTIASSTEVDCVDYTTLCIPAVPSYFNPNDFLGFVGEKTWEQVSNFRLIMTEEKNRYLVLMKFRDSLTARRWKADWDGKIYSSMEPETCHVLFIKSITFQTPSTSFPELSNDPFTSSASNSLDPFPAPMDNLVELPTCPVCLERMDDTTGLLTTQCQHVFHCACLQKWQSRSCPVCRHSNAQEHLLIPFGSGSEALCDTCDATEDLWICLICGNVGCGRYKGGHAKEHWKGTAHNFALEILTQHIWDYATSDTGGSDTGGWVHRLIRGKGMDKVEEMPVLTTERWEGDMVPREKAEAKQSELVEMTMSIMSQKDRLHEQAMARALKEVSAATAAAEAAAKKADEALQSLTQLQLSHSQLQSEVTSLSHDLTREKDKSTRTHALAKDLTKKYQDEKMVSSGLLSKVNHLKERIESKDSEIRKLKEEKSALEEFNQDLRGNLEAAFRVSALKDEGEELGDAKLSVPGRKYRKKKGSSGEGEASGT